MKTLYFYADSESLKVLSGSREKLVLVGSDFGYGNFGDVLQHRNAIQNGRASGRYAVVSVMASNAIGFQGFPQWARSAYDTDAIVFVSEYPLILDDTSPPLKPVHEICNLAGVHLYGGGFLNAMWGEYVLGVAEYFLQATPGAGYVITGQQVTSPFHERVGEHVRRFQPSLFGVRDEGSLRSLSELGLAPQFSFDDATESLLQLTQRVPLRRGPGLLLHMNASAYTSDTPAENALASDLRMLSNTPAAREGVTLLQAFRDARQEVLDSVETLKGLDALFPFWDMRWVSLMGLALRPAGTLQMPALVGQWGYSSSYHVALWLQLAGIPCWLRSANAFYRQKASALQVSQSLEAFLREPELADHGENLERRAIFQSQFSEALAQFPSANHVCRLKGDGEGPAPWHFVFKGRPSVVEQLTEANQELGVLRGRVEALITQVTAVGEEWQHQKARADRMEQELETLRRETPPEGSPPLSYERYAKGVVRFLQSGHFDAAGQVGLSDALRRGVQKASSAVSPEKLARLVRRRPR